MFIKGGRTHSGGVFSASKRFPTGRACLPGFRCFGVRCAGAGHRTTGFRCFWHPFVSLSTPKLVLRAPTHLCSGRGVMIGRLEDILSLAPEQVRVAPQNIRLSRPGDVLLGQEHHLIGPRTPSVCPRQHLCRPRHIALSGPDHAFVGPRSCLSG